MSAATTVYPLPDAAMVRGLFGLLFDGLTVKPAGRLDVSPMSGAYFAVYVTDAGAPAAICACDIAFAANSAAALSMMPANAAAGAVMAKQLTDVMLANLREVMNICTRLVLRDGTPHVKLRELCQFAALPAPAAAILGAATARIDFEVGISKYGRGVIAVLTL